MNQPQVLMVQQEPQGNGGETPPARVLTALKFLNDTTTKQMSRICPVAEWKCEEIKGLELAPMEVEAEKAAHRLLIDYFKGTLAPDCREQLDIEVFKAEQPKTVERPSIACPACSLTQPKPECLYCDGTGRCLIVPARRDSR